MPQLDEQRRGSRVVVHVPTSLRGVAVIRTTNGGELLRALPESFSSVLQIGGRAEWTMRGAEWSSAPGMVGVKIPGEVYAERKRDGVGRCQVVKFDDSLVEDARAALGRHLGAPADHAMDGRDPRVGALATLHRRLLDDEATTAALEQDLCEALTALVELTSVERGARRIPSASTAAVARARAMLDERLTEAVTLDELAAHARLDKYRLCRAFRDELGLPPHAYVTHRRIGRAQRLLARGLSQGEVAARVGLYDQSQLHRHFKRIVGVTPGAYARAVRA